MFFIKIGRWIKCVTTSPTFKMLAWELRTRLSSLMAAAALWLVVFMFFPFAYEFYKLRARVSWHQAIYPLSIWLAILGVTYWLYLQVKARENADIARMLSESEPTLATAQVEESVMPVLAAPSPILVARRGEEGMWVCKRCKQPLSADNRCDCPEGSPIAMEYWDVVPRQYQVLVRA